MGKLGWLFIGMMLSLGFLSCNTGVFSSFSYTDIPPEDSSSSPKDEVEINIDIHWE